MKTAMRAKDKPTLGTIRLILADIKRIEVDERIDIDDQRVLSVLDKMLKQRRDSIEQYRAAGRDDLAIIEEQEMVVIQSFLPTPLSEADIAELIAAAIADTGASSIKDMGKIMAQLKPQLQGRADIGAVSGKIKAALG
ncbi:MAG: glutamyl-tRNA amidotransferase [Actinobacteria bacterium TMED172]|nr:glutamyl-tRNA amidotransferase [Cellvibrionales bacterium]OUW32185.1 MAG: glutamyl-tRNA amidotransferase [Actinobacteria bacterium TMED172]